MPKTPTPKLLSGGNPQIAKADGDAPVQLYLDAMPGWKQYIGRRLDTLIVRLVPDVQKVVRWNTPFYGTKGNGWFLGFRCFTRYVRLTFLNGQSLHPMPPGPSNLPNVRYFDCYENEAVDEKQLTSWIRQAAKLPGDKRF